ncbi:DUF3631 domain-containing protein [Nocardia farcinica]
MTDIDDAEGAATRSAPSGGSAHPFEQKLIDAGLMPAPPARRPLSPLAVVAAPGDPAARRYGLAALRKECERVAGAIEGTRNHTLNRAAFSIGQLVAGGYLSEEEAMTALNDAGRACGLPDDEIDSVVPRSLRDGAQQPRSVQLSPANRPRNLGAQAPADHCSNHQQREDDCASCTACLEERMWWTAQRAAAHRLAADRAAVLDAVRELFGKYVRFPDEHCLTAVTLWAAHTWAVPAFYVTPRLVLDSPEPGSGKTRVLELLALTCRSAKLTLSTTTAALYRRIAQADVPPTVLQDEADAVFGRSSTPQTEDLRALFNAGYKRGATVDRCEGDSKKMTVREFPVFAPVALAGIAGNMPATITTRSVTIHMRRRAPGEKVAPFRERDADAEAEPLRHALEAWADANLAELEEARPDMPAGVEDRPAEVWEALIAVADNVGGHWPEMARAACKHFVLNTDPGELSRGVRLLDDVRKAFGERDAMHSADVVAALVADEEAPWADLYGKPIDQRRLARELKRYGVESAQIKIDGRGAKGYRIDGPDGLIQAWERYLPGFVRNQRYQRNPAGHTVSHTKPVSDASETAFLSETGESAPDLVERRKVSEVSEVSHTSGFRSDAASAPVVRTPGRKAGQWLGSGEPIAKTPEAS